MQNDLTTQTMFDLLAIDLNDQDLLDLIKRQQNHALQKYTTEDTEAHNQLATYLIKGLDNCYGEGSYQHYLDFQVLPSQQ